MTLEQLDKLIDARLRLDGRPVIEFNRLPGIIGCPPGSWWALTKDLTPEEMPRSAFRAGGTTCLQTDEAAAWCRAFVRRDPKRFGVTVEAKP